VHDNEYVQTVPIQDGVKRVYYTVYAEDEFGNFLISEEFSIDIPQEEEKDQGTSFLWYLIPLFLILIILGSLITYFLVFRKKEETFIEE